MKVRWIMTRIDADTHARLVAFRDRMEAEGNLNAARARPWQVGGACLADAIRELLFREDEKNQRAAASAQRHRKTGRRRKPARVAAAEAG